MDLDKVMAGDEFKGNLAARVLKTGNSHDILQHTPLSVMLQMMVPKYVLNLDSTRYLHVNKN